MASQPDITAKRRSILVDWWIDVHQHSISFVPREEFQLVGINNAQLNSLDITYFYLVLNSSEFALS
ncbi:hypothetical protein MTR_5g088940 [Medicago truncatula]|uniref:Uncharacterized protein n=1 Tax=Medicago truncatula TaxID=3880 RepID=G7KCT7_MEDTR|nr:hypothetical protein MTR_5g088940 [Medicago truncatula]